MALVQLTLAASETLTEADLPGLEYPGIISPKLDGYRCAIQEGRALSRDAIEVANRYAFNLLSSLPIPFDGELTVGNPWDDGVFNRTGSALRTITGTPDFVFNVFDRLDLPELGFEDRLEEVKKAVAELNLPWLKVVEHRRVNNAFEILQAEQEWVSAGYEGVMYRRCGSKYLNGRATRVNNHLLRFKRFFDSEFEVLEVLEGKANVNPATKSALGLMQRATHAKGMIPNGQCGGFRGRDIYSKQEFKVAPGKMTKEQAIEIFQNKDKYVGNVGVYRYDKKGGYSLPRFPTFQGWRTDLKKP